MLEGALAALDKVCEQTGEKEINAIGYCLGGTLLGSTLAYLAAKKDKRIASATFFTTMLDFSIPGELGVFIDEEQLASLEKKMERARLPRRHRDGRHLQHAARQRPDLVLRGQQLPAGQGPLPLRPAVLELRLHAHAGAMHSFYLRNMYMNNLLQGAGRHHPAGVADRPAQDQDAGLLHLHHRRPHRAVEEHLPRRAAASPARCASCSAAPATSPASSIRRRPTSTATGPTTRPCRRRPTNGSTARQAARRLLVDRLAGMGDGAWTTRKVPARDPAKGKLKRARRRPGLFVKFRLDTQKKSVMTASRYGSSSTPTYCFPCSSSPTAASRPCGRLEGGELDRADQRALPRRIPPRARLPHVRPEPTTQQRPPSPPIPRRRASSSPAAADAVALPRCKDRDDQKFLELARDGSADWLVTSDKALLKLARRRKLAHLFRILTPDQSLAR